MFEVMSTQQGDCEQMYSSDISDASQVSIAIELILTLIRSCVDNHKCHTEKSMQQKSHGLLAARTSAHIDLYMYLYYVHIYIYTSHATTDHCTAMPHAQAQAHGP